MENVYEMRAEQVKQWARENSTPVQELCPELNQYFKVKDGYEMWNSRTHVREAIYYNPTTWRATTDYNLINKVSVKSDYDGLYIRYIEELDVMEISMVIMNGGRGQNGVAKEWKFYTNSWAHRYFFFHEDKNVYTDAGVICTPSVGGRYNKDVFDRIRRWNVFHDNTNKSEFEKFVDIDVTTYCRWNQAGSSWWSPDPTYYAVWYKKDFAPKKASKTETQLDSYEFEDVEFDDNITSNPWVMYYQQLDADMAVLRCYQYKNTWTGYRNGAYAGWDGYEKTGNEKREICRLFITSKGKPTFVTKEAGKWIIKASIPYGCDKEMGVINREEMETWKPLKYILPCIDKMKIQNIVNYLRHPIVEQLYKSGYKKLAKKVQDGGTIAQNLKDNFLIKRETKQPLYKMLGVNKFVLNIAEEYDSLFIVKQLKYFYGQFDISHCPEDVARKIAKMIGSGYRNTIQELLPSYDRYDYYWRRRNGQSDPELSDDDRKWVLKLMRIEDKHNGAIEAYKDAVSTYRSIQDKPEIDLYNLHSYEDIERLHDALVAIKVREDAERQARYNEARRAELEKAQKNFEKLQKARIEKFEYEEGNYCVRVPHELTEITQEGMSLHHCVGGYLDRHANGRTNILFLRRKGIENVPFFTIEIDNDDNVIQIHGSHNRWLGNEPDAVPFMYKYLKRIGAKFTNNLLLNKGAGYSPSSESLDESYLAA